MLPRGIKCNRLNHSFTKYVNFDWWNLDSANDPMSPPSYRDQLPPETPSLKKYYIMICEFWIFLHYDFIYVCDVFHCMFNKCNRPCFLFHTVSAYVAYSFSFVKQIGIIRYFYNITILHTILYTKLFIKYYFTNSDSICNVATACCQYKTDYTTLIWSEYQIDNEWNSCTISLIVDNLENSMLEEGVQIIFPKISWAGVGSTHLDPPNLSSEIALYYTFPNLN
jgi:hypothetical protein